jgi:hypothetical protein
MHLFVLTLVSIFVGYLALNMLFLAYGDKFTSPYLRLKHREWMQGWIDTANPRSRYLGHILLLFFAQVVFNLNDYWILGGLVLIRILLYTGGYLRIMKRLDSRTPPNKKIVSRLM